MNTINPSVDQTNIYKTLTTKTNAYISSSIGQNLKLVDNIFEFLQAGTYVFNINARVANSITAMV